MSEADTTSQTDAGKGNGTTGDVQKPTWIEQLPEDQRGNESLYQYKTIGDLSKAHMALSSEREGMFKVPGDDATVEEKNAFFQKMGRPETPEGYVFTKPETWPEEVPYNSGLETSFKQAAFNAGLPANQAKAILDWYTTASLEEHNAVAAATDKAVNDLKNEWKGDAFKVNAELAHRTFKKYGDEKAAEFMESAMVDGIPLGSHPRFLKIFAAIGKTISDDSLSMEREGNLGELSDEDKARQRFPNTTFKKN